MLETLCDHAKSKRLYAGDGFIPVLAVGHDAGQIRHFGEPATVILKFDFDHERHGGNVPFEPAV
jgi:hypothetical protein